ncbi:uncharacterized protein AKAME5_000143400 [Lates japonicus]|uniref:Uncharacterized protein n=1 Tax=Lates japonicus TaxID=270547 RepID=A0AAD3M4G0_LATJO|nr:uncharacterized protein AKAME5_000143400 [Lates japonicus]
MAVWRRRDSGQWWGGRKGGEGCWESGRQLPGSDNRGCILIFRHRMREKPALLLPHHPVRKTINPAIREQSTELSPGYRWLRVTSAPIIHQPQL